MPTTLGARRRRLPRVIAGRRVLCGHERRLAEIDNGLQRTVDLYIDGKVDREGVDKRHDALRAEARALERLLADASADQPELTPDVIKRLAGLFSNWTLLRREEKRVVLHEFGARVVVARPRKRELAVRELRLAALDTRVMYKL